MILVPVGLLLGRPLRLTRPQRIGIAGWLVNVRKICRLVQIMRGIVGMGTGRHLKLGTGYNHAELLQRISLRNAQIATTATRVMRGASLSLVGIWVQKEKMRAGMFVHVIFLRKHNGRALMGKVTKLEEWMTDTHFAISNLGSTRTRKMTNWRMQGIVGEAPGH
jgi:hypothetical protein